MIFFPLSLFLHHTQRRITVGGTPLDEWSARRRDLNLTIHNTHNRQTSMPRWELIFIITPKNAHVISIKLFYNCCTMFRWPRTIFKELILLTSSLHTPNQDLNYEYIRGHILQIIRFCHNDLLLYVILLF